MKTYQITEEQIERIHECTSTENQEEIEQWFPEVFKPDFVGKWVEDTVEPGFLMFVESQNEEYIFGYGISDEGSWFNADLDGFASFEDKREAPAEKVEQMLRKEAERRGFVKYAMFREAVRKKPIHGESIGKVGNIRYIVHYSGENVLLTNGRALFSDGRWAEVQPATELTIEQIEEKLGYKIKIVNG